VLTVEVRLPYKPKWGLGIIVLIHKQHFKPRSAWDAERLVQRFRRLPGGKAWAEVDGKPVLVHAGRITTDIAL
jgi:hypothetical protein